MEKLEIVSLVCTFGVVGCGLTVIVSATVKVVRDIFNKDAPDSLVATVLSKDDQPWMSTTTRRITRQTTNTTPRQRKRGLQCDKCAADISAEQVIRSDTVDEHTYLVRVCPSCKEECSTAVK